MTAPDMTIRETTMAVFKPKNSKNYHFRYMLNGKIHTGSTKTSNRQTAERFEAQHKVERYKVLELGERERITIKDAFNNLLDTKKKLTSFHLSLTKANKLLGVVFDKITKTEIKCHGFNPNSYLDTLGEKDIQRLIVAREKEGLNTSTLIHELSFINQAINLAARMQYKVPSISISDLKKDNSIRPSRGKLRYLSLDEEARLLEELNPFKNLRGISPVTDTGCEKFRARQDTYDLVILLLDTGARYSEIAEIKWSSINMLDRTIEIYRSKVKNQSILMMTDRVYSTLFRRFNDPNRGIHVFTDSSRVDVRRYTPTAFASACRRAGIEDCTYHTLRHTFASRMVQAGLPLTDVQQILGHATIHMTLKYSHLAPQESTKKAAALLNQINRTGQPVPVM